MPARGWLTGAAIHALASVCAVSTVQSAENAPLYLVPDDRRPLTQSIGGALWHDTEWGWIVADSTSAARQAAIDLRASVAAFHAHFGIAPGRGAIIQSRYAGLFEPLKAAGLEWQVPWRIASPSTGQAAVGHSADHRSALRHEVAHALFIALVISSTRKGQYGGDAPDWLDEAAAMTAETPEGTAARREAFMLMVEQGRVRALSQFVAEEHPLFEAPAIKSALAEARKRDPQSPVVLSFNARDIGIDRQAVGDFYAQSRAVLDFLQETTGDQRILAAIARDFLKTRDPLSWVTLVEKELAQDDAIAAIDAAFQQWSEGLSRRGR